MFEVLGVCYASLLTIWFSVWVEILHNYTSHLQSELIFDFPSCVTRGIRRHRDGFLGFAAGPLLPVSVILFGPVGSCTAECQFFLTPQLLFYFSVRYILPVLFSTRLRRMRKKKMTVRDLKAIMSCCCCLHKATTARI